MNVFLDCGTHFGQGLASLVKKHNMNSTWHVETYEANPVTFNKHLNNRMFDFVQYKNIAVYDRDGVVDFNIETPPNEDDTGMGSSLIDLSLWNPWKGKIRENFNKTVKMNCFDFPLYVETNFNSQDNIICKLDIEGSEYAVLERIIEKNIIPYFKKIYVEFHANFFRNKDEMVNKELKIKQHFNNAGLQLETWY